LRPEDAPFGLVGMKRSHLVVILLCAVSLALLAAGEINRRDLVLLNASPSVPTGFYVRTDIAPSEGAFVTVRAADVAGDYARVRRFTDDGDRFIKRVAARAGVRVCAEGAIVTVGARTHVRRAHDSAGRALPTWEFCRVLQDGEMVLMGETPDSFDSRYFGIVREDAIEGVWTRLAIFPD
jgi:conjugative transfer signal peptidase TraF